MTTIPPEAEAPAEEQAHAVSMAAWDTPAPAIAAAAAHVKIGAQCSCGCDLSGARLMLVTEEGDVIAEAVVDQTQDDDSALYYAEMTFIAPAQTGICRLAATLAGDDDHHSAEMSFGFRVEPKPAFKAIVRAIYQPTGEPVIGAEIRMNLYEAYTDERGVATFALPPGRYTCTFRNYAQIAEPIEIDVTDDADLTIRAERGETREELEARLSRMEDRWSA